MLSAYINTFFVALYRADAFAAAAEIAPVVEEVMKFLPLLIYLAVFEPRNQEIVPAALGIAVGFATFENVCFLAENGAADFSLLLIRGISAGALHILCGIALGYSIAHVFRRSWIMLTGAIGSLGACVVFHGIYNLLITADGKWKLVGYLFPSIFILLLCLVKNMKFTEKFTIE